MQKKKKKKLKTLTCYLHKRLLCCDEKHLPPSRADSSVHLHCALSPKCMGTCSGGTCFVDEGGISTRKKQGGVSSGRALIHYCPLCLRPDTSVRAMSDQWQSLPTFPNLSPWTFSIPHAKERLFPSTINLQMKLSLLSFKKDSVFHRTVKLNLIRSLAGKAESQTTGP